MTDGIFNSDTFTEEARSEVLLSTAEAQQRPRAQYPQLQRRMSFMEWITEDEIQNALQKAGSDPEVTAREVSQRFKGVHYPQHPENSVNGAFRYHLIRNSDTLFGLRIEVRLKLVSEGGALDNVVVDAQDAISNYWGGYSLNSATCRVVIIPTVYHDDDEHDITVSVYPDEYENSIIEEVKEYHIEVRETLSFMAVGVEDDPDYDKKARWPHEYGHIIGLPHDMNFRSVMYSPPAGRPYSPRYDLYWRYGFAEARPRPEHFKLVKVWVERVIAQQYGEDVDFVVRAP